MKDSTTLPVDQVGRLPVKIPTSPTGIDDLNINIHPRWTTFFTVQRNSSLPRV